MSKRRAEHEPLPARGGTAVRDPPAQPTSQPAQYTHDQPVTPATPFATDSGFGHDFTRIAVDATCDAGATGFGSTPAPRAPLPDAPPTRTLAYGLLNATKATTLIDLVSSQLFPAYRRAVDALDPVSSLELARHVVGSWQFVAEAKDELLQSLPSDDVHHYMVSIAGQPDESEAEITGKFEQLKAQKNGLLPRMQVVENELALGIGPQMFRGEPVLGSFSPVSSKDLPGYLANEAGAAVELIAAVLEVRNISGAKEGTCPVLDPKQRIAIVKHIEPWKSRPINFAFLRFVLQHEGIWEAVADEPGARGKTLEQTNDLVREQIEATGALADVGDLDIDTLHRLFGIDRTDPSRFESGPPGIDDDTAMRIFDKLRDVSPEARGPLIRQIADMRELHELCEHLPWKYIQAIHDSVVDFDRDAAALLRPHFEGKGGGKSMHRIYMDEVDEDLEEGQTIRAFGWFFLDTLHNAFTGGFEHEYSEAYDAHEQGWTTDDQFSSQATKALGKAAAITVISAITGGVAGEFAEGAAAGLGASRSAAQIIGGGVGGFAGGVSGHFTGDVYDQLLNDKEGFDSLGDYMKSGAMGGAAGTVLAGVSVGAGKYLGGGKRPIDTFADRHPRMTKVLEDVRASGFRSGVKVRMKVADLLELMGSGFGGPDGPDAFAYAGAYGDVRALPPDTEISVRLRPLRPLTQPMQMSTTGDKVTGNDVTEPTIATESPTAMGEEQPMVAIEKVEVTDAPPTAIQAPTVEGKSLSAPEWIDRLKAIMTVEENAQFEAMRANLGSDAQIQARFKGNFDAARQQTRNALGTRQGKKAFLEASRMRAAELRATIAKNGLMADPAIAKIIERLGPNPTDAELAAAIEPIRNKLVGDIVGEEIAAKYPGKDVLREVQISEETPATSIDDYMNNYAKAEGKTSTGGLREIETPNGKRVYIKRTDIDILVVERPPEGGRLRIVHREEVKSGRHDQAKGNPKRPGAEDQLKVAKDLLSEAGKGVKKIRVEVGGRNVTDDIDLSSVDASTEATRGPAGKKGFNESLGITADDLRGLIEDLTRQAAAAVTRAPSE